MVETSPKWHDIAEREIEQGDSIERSYEGKLDGKYGYLLLSKRKLLFVREEGYLRKSYDLILDLPYDKIGVISHKGRYTIEFFEGKDKKHDFESYSVLASRIEEGIENIAHLQ